MIINQKPIFLAALLMMPALAAPLAYLPREELDTRGVWRTTDPGASSAMNTRAFEAPSPPPNNRASSFRKILPSPSASNPARSPTLKLTRHPREVTIDNSMKIGVKQDGNILHHTFGAETEQIRKKRRPLSGLPQAPAGYQPYWPKEEVKIESYTAPPTLAIDPIRVERTPRRNERPLGPPQAAPEEWAPFWPEQNVAAVSQSSRVAGATATRRSSSPQVPAANGEASRNPKMNVQSLLSGSSESQYKALGGLKRKRSN